MQDLEGRLQFAMVAYVGGGRPAISCALVHEVLVRVLGLPSNGFSVHQYRPEDFLVVFAMAELRNLVATRSLVRHAGSAPFLRKWTRQSQATPKIWRFKDDLVIEGVPPHVFQREVVENLLGSSCSIDEIALETASRMDLATFKVSVWTNTVGKIPTVRTLAILEPVEYEVDTPPPAQALSDDTSATLPVMSEKENRLLRYMILIHVDKIEEDAEGGQGTSPAPSDEHQRNLPGPRNTDGGGGVPGRVVRQLGWHMGVPDRWGGGDGRAQWTYCQVAASSPPNWRIHKWTVVRSVDPGWR
jgi:hypothetical protein